MAAVGEVSAGSAEKIGGAGGLTHRQIMVALSGLMLGMLLSALDQTIVSTALPTIVGDLGGLNHLSWVVTAYLLTSTAVTPLYGKISDLYGRKRLFQFAIVVFLIGSALAGLSQNMGELIAFRALQGVGGGGIFAMVLSIIGDIVPPRQRGKYQGYMGAVFASASVFGPLAGGFLTDQISWRWIFYVNLPIGIFALIVTSIVLKLPVNKLRHKIDFLGSALVSAAVTTLLLVTVWGGQTYAWGSTTIVALIAASLALAAAFIWREAKAAEPILPLGLFRNRVFSVSSAMGFISGFALFGAVIYLPEYMQMVRGVSPTGSGLMLIPLTLGIVIGSVGSGQMISRMGKYRIFPIVGSAMLIGGFYLLSLFKAHTPYYVEAVYMLITGVGLGLSIQVIVLATQNSVSMKEMGTATSAVTFFRTMGGAIGTSFFGNILINRLTHNLTVLLPGAGASARGAADAAMSGTPAAMSHLPAPVHSAVIDSFVRSLHVVFLWAIPFAVISLVLALVLPERPLRSTSGAHHGQQSDEEFAAPMLLAE
ncbi:MAG: MDR family MFS transporter [Actinomycetota bacterium]|nr:MDR family MFS transporter [Actinomycetota bacterium]